MDILLTHAYFLQEDPGERKIMKPYPPLGILYVSSHLKAKGFRVEVFDTTFRSNDDLKRFFERHRPAVVGIYCNLMTRTNALLLMRWAKKCGARVVVGGPEPVNYPQEYLRHGADVVVAGEGEITLEELLRQWKEEGAADLAQIAGISFIAADGRLVTTPPRPAIQDLDAQPWPDRDAIDMHQYVDAWRSRHGRGSVSLITSRGCPYTCTWCSHSVFGYTYRSRSPSNVADELEMILEKYQPEMVWYSDDVFTINRRWLLKYAEELDRRGLRAPFETISREDRLDDEIVKTLARMGCLRLWVGSESGSQRILDAMKRRTDALRVREVVRLLQTHGIEAGLFFMLGYEGETLDDIAASVEHLKAARPDAFLTTLSYPIKGTPYYQQVADRIIPLKPWEQGSDRDLTVAGRRSRLFYSFANRWISSEFRLQQALRGEKREMLAAAKALLSSHLGRLGMRLTRAHREGDGRRAAARSPQQA